RERAAAAAYWSQPMYAANLAYVDRGAYPFTYAFRHGAAFVAVIDASSALVDDHQRVWLTDVLARPEATSAALRVVMGHLPLVGVSTKTGPGEVVTRGADLARLLQDLASEDALEGVGFSASEVSKLIDELLEGQEAELEDPGAEEPPELPISRLGDLWVLGGHRLLCGD
ncbi:MAG: hypothetical protein ACNA8R_15885, partial [Nitriliruptoraceae bacterium]